MLEEMSAGQLVEWETMCDYWHMGDYPGYRADIIGATQAALLANLHRGRGQRAYTVGDFLPVFQEPSEDPEGDLWQSLIESSIPRRTGKPPRKPARATLRPHKPKAE